MQKRLEIMGVSHSRMGSRADSRATTGSLRPCLYLFILIVDIWVFSKKTNIAARVGDFDTIIGIKLQS